MPFVEVHQIFVSGVDLSSMLSVWDETCQVVSLQWLEPFDEGQWLVVSDRCLIAYSFCWDPSDFGFWGGFPCWTAFFLGRSSIGTDITVCLSQLFGSWVHWWRRVPFWVDASAVVTEATPFVCDDVVKTKNLNWIFLLDVSLLWGWPMDASVLLSTSGNLDLFQIYLLFCCLNRSVIVGSFSFWLLK